MKLRASLALITSFYIQVSKKKCGFLISWQHLCHTTRTPAGGLERPNKSFFHHAQTPMAATHPLPSYFHYTHPRQPGTERGKSQERRKAGEPRQGAEVLILDLKAMQRRKRSPPTTYFRHRVHVLCMRGDSPQGLGRRARRRVALLHQVRQIDVTCKAIAGCVARTLFFTRGLQRHKA